ncbi:MAG: class I SAM-dependent methyltransferase [Anaerolineales bacterium]|nr:class I SAM-dependent methyltransferase [Anaerolineales bacterium]MCK5634790.1 class I SAM-dependent methyltransferase [Anaerolineales bacterium]
MSARFRLHRDFSTSQHSFPHWVFDQFDFEATTSILEIGCGPGYLWVENRERVHHAWEIVLADRSFGILAEAHKNFRDWGLKGQWINSDAQVLPLDEYAFDVVVANHMLYHVEDRPGVFGEICRVMKPGGRLFAATNGREHLREIRELIERFHLNSSIWTHHNAFSLENGEEQLRGSFERVSLARFNDSLEVTEIEPIMAYIKSGFSLEELAANTKGLQAIQASIGRQLIKDGVIHIRKDTGMFIAENPHSI